jgi:putative ABC transport system ATP-binding protein
MLVGPSGCGKTTLISIMTGILSATSGDTEIFGTSINQMSDYDKVIFRRNNIGFIFQQYNLISALTAAENASIPMLAREDIEFDDAVEKARKILNSIGMNNQTDQLPSQLSGGQQQRVAIARALINEPRFIICDEPTAALDAETGKTVIKILQDISRDENRAVLVITHDERIYQFSDRILTMSDGRITGDYKPSELKDRGYDC